jgi:hypothetical protein
VCYYRIQKKQPELLLISGKGDMLSLGNDCILEYKFTAEGNTYDLRVMSAYLCDKRLLLCDHNRE